MGGKRRGTKNEGRSGWVWIFGSLTTDRYRGRAEGIREAAGSELAVGNSVGLPGVPNEHVPLSPGTQVMGAHRAGRRGRAHL